VENLWLVWLFVSLPFRVLYWFVTAGIPTIWQHFKLNQKNSPRRFGTELTNSMGEGLFTDLMLLRFLLALPTGLLFSVWWEKITHSFLKDTQLLHLNFFISLVWFFLWLAGIALMAPGLRQIILAALFVLCQISAYCSIQKTSLVASEIARILSFLNYPYVSFLSVSSLLAFVVGFLLARYLDQRHSGLIATYATRHSRTV
jgi:hypothetical protein